MIFYSIVEWFAAAADALMFFMLFEKYLQRREKWFFGYRIAGFILLALLIYGVVSETRFILAKVLGMICIAIFVSGTYKGAFYKRIVAVVIAIAISGVAAIIAFYSVVVTFNISFEDAICIPNYRMLGILASKNLGIAVCNGIRLHGNGRKINIEAGYWSLSAFLFLSVLSAVFLLFKMSCEFNDVVLDGIVLVCSFGLFFSTLFVIWFNEKLAVQYEIIGKQEKYEQYLKAQIGYLDEMIANQNEVKRFKHDINNQMIVLKKYLDCGDLQGGKNYLATLSEQFGAIVSVVDTGNSALDTILSVKKVLAESKGIIFNLKLQISADLSISSTDLCTIFGNALDNAIEACERLSNGPKIIDVSVMQQEYAVICKITNTAPVSIDDLFVSQKEDTSHHGFGLESIKITLAKYDTVPVIEQNGEEFTLSFVIYL